MTTAPTKGFFGHPAGLGTLFTTEMWERFSYYGLRPLLVLFMSAAILDGGFGFSREAASAIVGIYAGSVYLASLPGGWIADRWLGLRRAIWWGALLITLGHLSIGLSGMAGQGAAGKATFFAGLTLIVMGTGLLKPNISAIVGDLYPEGGARRDAGFSIFYMGINTGAFLGQLITGFLGEQIGWHWGFGAAGVGMFFGLVTFTLFAPKTLGDLGTEIVRDPDPAVQAAREGRVKAITFGALALVIAAFGAAAMGLFTLDPVVVVRQMIAAQVLLAAIFFGVVFADRENTAQERKQILVILVLFLFAAIFWGAFEQAPTSLNLFARDFTDRTVGSFEMPATWFQSINSFWIILLAPFFAALWEGMAKGGRELSAPAKFAAGLVLAGLGFALMVIPANAIVASGGALKVAPWWLVGSYFLQTAGELCLSPVGLSSMTKLSPRKYVGQMMGIWFIAASLGNLIAGLVGGQVDPEALEQTPQLFTWTAIALFLSAAVLAMMIGPIRRMLADKR
ncbi:MAG TPA: peptide MFS transporter [Gemmatimonadales bacterium]|nr:peptide MFS transporter [Gemmatimonadales bacterium]